MLSSMYTRWTGRRTVRERFVPGIVRLCVSVSLLVLGSPAARAASTADIPSSANIIMPLQLTVVGDGALSFGDFVTTNDGYGSVTVQAWNGFRSQAGGITLAGGDVSNVIIKVSGEPYQALSIEYPSSFTLTDSTTGERLNVWLLTHGEEPIPSTGEGTFRIGGNIYNIPPHHPAGRYEGNFTVSVSYE